MRQWVAESSQFGTEIAHALDVSPALVYRIRADVGAPRLMRGASVVRVRRIAATSAGGGMIVFGIDIGVTGAMAAVDSRGTASVVDLPTVEDAAGKRIAGRELLNAIRAMSPAGESSLAIIEDVRPRPGPNTAHTMGSLMGTRRSIGAVLDVAGVKVIAVQPATWKRFFGLIRPRRRRAWRRRAACSHCRGRCSSARRTTTAPRPCCWRTTGRR